MTLAFYRCLLSFADAICKRSSLSPILSACTTDERMPLELATTMRERTKILLDLAHQSILPRLLDKQDLLGALDVATAAVQLAHNPEEKEHAQSDFNLVIKTIDTQEFDVARTPDQIIATTQKLLSSISSDDVPFRAADVIKSRTDMMIGLYNPEHNLTALDFTRLADKMVEFSSMLDEDSTRFPGLESAFFEAQVRLCAMLAQRNELTATKEILNRSILPKVDLSRPLISNTLVIFPVKTDGVTSNEERHFVPFSPQHLSLIWSCLNPRPQKQALIAFMTDSNPPLYGQVSRRSCTLFREFHPRYLAAENAPLMQFLSLIRQPNTFPCIGEAALAYFAANLNNRVKRSSANTPH